MITIKYLSEDYDSVKETLAELLGEHYTGMLDDFDYAPYGVESVLVHKEDVLLDVKVFDPYGKLQTGLYINHDGWSDWLCSYCSDSDLMREGNLTEEEIKEIEEL